MEDYEITYGTKVRDTLTGYEGTVTGLCTYWGHGEDCFMVESATKDNVVQRFWVDCKRCEVILPFE